MWRQCSGAESKDFVLNAFVRIGADESVTVISAHSEMGQGIYTSLPMLLNEELEADWAKIRVEAAPVDKAYNHPLFGIQMTGGSTTSPAEWERYRKMGATARMMLVEAAAKRWGVGCGEPCRKRLSTCKWQARNVWLVGRCSSAVDATGERSTEEFQNFHADWQAHSKIGHSLQGKRNGAIWIGRQDPRDAHRSCVAPASFWRQS